ncbi:MAG: PGF-pre-PGF domain-containing protein, partial [Methanocorpusculum sp.]|nr:PGF-pre-PGF domain-containing protein [Methanocorpusculum sp.]
ESKTPAPEGKETVTVFEINILNYPSGKESEVQFKLTVAEIEKAGHRPADICLYHCDSKGVWTKLPTTYSVKDGVVYYEALTTEFSPFAIVYEEGGAEEIKQPAVKETETQKALPQPTYTEPTITATPKAEQAKSTIGLIGLIAGLGCYLVALRRK